MVFCSKITELITIKLPIKNNTLGTSPNIKKVKIIPKIGNRE